MSSSERPEPLRNQGRIAGLLFGLLIVAVYALSLPGGFLNYDDAWLVADNPVLHLPAAQALPRIWLDLSEATRHTLGAEYLPVRDTSHFIEAHTLGLVPPYLRVVSLGLYVGAALLMRRYLLRALGAGTPAEVAAWLFALHPVHVESVAWLAGRKDVLGLLFTAAALAVYAGSSRSRLWLVPALVTLACLSKAVAVVTPGLLLMHDFWTRRRPHAASVLASTVAATAALAVHVKVGVLVVMMTPPAGGGRLAVAATMGPVWARYLGNLFWPSNLSIVYDVPARGAGDLAGWSGYLVLVAWGAASGWILRRTGRRTPLVALAWFVLPLLPVSQIAAPLQNLMADRYLLLAALAPCLLVAAALEAAPASVRPAPKLAAVAALGLGLALLTAFRAYVMSDGIRLWTDATRASRSAQAPYQLGLAHEQRGAWPAAADAYRTAIARARPPDEVGRMARNNLGALLANAGWLPEARAILREAVVLYPEDPKVLNNLAEVTARMGETTTARELFEGLVRRFPAYMTGRKNYEQRFGAAPPR